MSPLWSLALACSPAPTPDDSGGPTDTDTGTLLGCADATDALGADPAIDRWNGEIALRAGDGFVQIAGAVLDGPVVRFQSPVDTIGACRLETYTPSTCDPVCAGGRLCKDGACVAPPQRLSAGALTVTGPLDPPLEAEPDALDGYYAWRYADVDRTVPWVLDGAAGAEVPAFTATTCPVSAPDPSGDWEAALAARPAGADVVLSWSNPDPGARIRMRMTTGTATHGGVAHAEIACEGPDTGSLTLPGAFLDALYAEGWGCGECGTNDLVRYRAGSIGETGAVWAAEAVTPFWHIPGRSR